MIGLRPAHRLQLCEALIEILPSSLHEEDTQKIAIDLNHLTDSPLGFLRVANTGSRR
jgi:hypothetical protein